MRLTLAIGVAALSGVGAAFGAVSSSSASDGGVSVLRLPAVQVTKLVSGRDRTVLALGVANGSQALVLRMHSDGSVDTSFGSGGRVLLPRAKGIGWTDGAVLPDGRVLVAGTDHYGLIDAGPTTATGSHLVLLMLDAKGHVSSAFGRNGYVISGQTSCLRGPTGVLVSGGRILVAALDWCRYQDPRTLEVLAFTPEGAPLDSFGTHGAARLWSIPLTALDRTPLLSAEAGRILVASPAATAGSFSLTRLRPDGTPDTAFGRGGTTTTVLGPSTTGIQLDGMFETRGGQVSTTGCAQQGPFIARFNRNGAPYTFLMGTPGGLTNVESYGGAFGSYCASFAQLTKSDVAAAGAVLAYLLPSGLLDSRRAFVRLPKMQAPSHALAVSTDGVLFVSSKIGDWTIIGRYR
ncbi:MAG TPA: hypothetical protein VMT59_12920 [Gaiellaceae bacterium]|nr:hypothetical protein [Gaiellaceae bacterium]